MNFCQALNNHSPDWFCVSRGRAWRYLYSGGSKLLSNTTEGAKNIHPGVSPGYDAGSPCWSAHLGTSRSAYHPVPCYCAWEGSRHRPCTRGSATHDEDEDGAAGTWLWPIQHLLEPLGEWTNKAKIPFSLCLALPPTPFFFVHIFVFHKRNESFKQKCLPQVYCCSLRTVLSSRHFRKLKVREDSSDLPSVCQTQESNHVKDFLSLQRQAVLGAGVWGWGKSVYKTSLREPTASQSFLHPSAIPTPKPYSPPHFIAYCSQSDLGHKWLTLTVGYFICVWGHLGHVKFLLQCECACFSPVNMSSVNLILRPSGDPDRGEAEPFLTPPTSQSLIVTVTVGHQLNCTLELGSKYWKMKIQSSCSARGNLGSQRPLSKHQPMEHPSLKDYLHAQPFDINFSPSS